MRFAPIVALLICVCLAGDADAARKPKSEVTLLAFEADWCAACQKMKPTLKKIEKKGYHVHRIDVDTEAGARLAKRYKVTALPTYIAVDDQGREQGREVGIVTEGVLLALLKIIRTVAIALIKMFFF